LVEANHPEISEEKSLKNMWVLHSQVLKSTRYYIGTEYPTNEYLEHTIVVTNIAEKPDISLDEF
jgi:hypothetical protein